MYNVHMKIVFVWDDKKNHSNSEKHGISFDEAATVFGNFPFQVFFDPDHSETEERYIAIGFSDKNRALLVIRCENKTGNEIRITSARKATKKEQQDVFGDK